MIASNSSINANSPTHTTTAIRGRHHECGASYPNRPKRNLRGLQLRLRSCKEWIQWQRNATVEEGKSAGADAAPVNSIGVTVTYPTGLHHHLHHLHHLHNFCNDIPSSQPKWRTFPSILLLLLRLSGEEDPQHYLLTTVAAALITAISLYDCRESVSYYKRNQKEHNPARLDRRDWLTTPSNKQSGAGPSE